MSVPVVSLKSAPCFVRQSGGFGFGVPLRPMHLFMTSLGNADFNKVISCMRYRVLLYEIQGTFV